MYGADVRRMRLRELCRFLPGPKGVLMWMLLRSGAAKAEVKLDQRVLPLWADTVTTWDQIRPSESEALRPSIDALITCGFLVVAVHRLVEPAAGTEGAGAYLLHPSGASFAFVSYVTNARSGVKLLATHVGTALTDGRIVSTTNQRTLLDYSLADHHWVRTSASGEVVRAHEARLARYEGRIQRVANGTELARLIDLHTVRSFEERVQRGVYVVGWASAVGQPPVLPCY